MDKFEVAGFLKFLEEASENEISDRQSKLRSILKLIDPDGDIAADVKFCLRLVDQELMTRAEVYRVRRK